jgi:hypothetical protein
VKTRTKPPKPAYEKARIGRAEIDDADPPKPKRRTPKPENNKAKHDDR